jgi:hypothetical protein
MRKQAETTVGVVHHPAWAADTMAIEALAKSASHAFSRGRLPLRHWHHVETESNLVRFWTYLDMNRPEWYRFRYEEPENSAQSWQRI